MSLVPYDLTGHFVADLGTTSYSAQDILLWPRTEIGDGAAPELTLRGWLIACTASTVDTILYRGTTAHPVLLSPGGGRAGIAFNLTASGHERVVADGSSLIHERVGANGVAVVQTVPLPISAYDLYHLAISGGDVLVNDQAAGFPSAISPTAGQRFGIYVRPSAFTRIGPVMSSPVVSSEVYSGSIDILGIPESAKTAQLVTDNWPSLFANTGNPLDCLASSSDTGVGFAADTAKKMLYRDSKLGIYWLYPDQLPPNAPSNFVGNPTGTTSIKWQWIDMSSFEDGFNLYDDAGNLLVQLPPNTTRYEETGLLPGTSYSRKLGAYNGNGESALLTAAAQTLAVVPTKPAWGLAIRSGDDVRLYWGDIPGASSVEIVSKSAGTVLATSPISQSSVIITTTENGFFVRGSTAGTNGPSLSVSASTVSIDTSERPALIGYPISHASVLWTWTANEQMDGLRIYDAAHRPLATLPADTSEYIEEGLPASAVIVRYARFVSGGGLSDASEPAATITPAPSGAVTPGTPESLPPIRRFTSGIGDGQDGELLSVAPEVPGEFPVHVYHQGLVNMAQSVPKEVAFRFRYYALIGSVAPTAPHLDYATIRIDRHAITTVTVRIQASATYESKSYTYDSTPKSFVVDTLDGKIVFTKDHTLLVGDTSATYPGPPEAVTWTVTQSSPGTTLHKWIGDDLVVYPQAEGSFDIPIEMPLNATEPIVIDPQLYWPDGPMAGHGLRWSAGGEANSGTLMAYFANNPSWAVGRDAEVDFFNHIHGTGLIHVAPLRGFPIRVDGEWFDGVVNSGNQADSFQAMLYLPGVDPAAAVLHYGVEVDDPSVDAEWNGSGAGTTSDVGDYCIFTSDSAVTKTVTTVWRDAGIDISLAEGISAVTLPAISTDPTYPGAVALLDPLVVATSRNGSRAEVVSSSIGTVETLADVNVSAPLDGNTNWRPLVRSGRIFHHQKPGLLVHEPSPGPTIDLAPAYWFGGIDSEGPLVTLPSAEVPEELDPARLKLRYDQPDTESMSVSAYVSGRLVSVPWSLEGRQLRIHTQMNVERISVRYKVVRSVYPAQDGMSLETHGAVGPVKLWSGAFDVPLPLDVHALSAPSGGYLVVENTPATVSQLSIQMPGGMVTGRTYVIWVAAADSAGNPVPGASVTLSAVGGTLSAESGITGTDGMICALFTPAGTLAKITAACGATTSIVAAPIYSLLSVARMRVTPTSRLIQPNEVVSISVSWIAPRPPEASFTPIELSVSGGEISASADGPWSGSLTVPPRPDGTSQIYLRSPLPGTAILSVESGEARGGAIVVVK